jgi:hypothetical protein
MSFVDHYLLYFRQQLSTCPLLSLLPFQLLFTESLGGNQRHAPLIFSGVLLATLSLCCVLVFSSLFIVQFFFFLQGVCVSVRSFLAHQVTSDEGLK